MQNENILRIEEVTAKTGLCRSSIYEYQAIELFPKSIKVGKRTVGWLESEVCAWIATRIAASRGASVNE